MGTAAPAILIDACSFSSLLGPSPLVVIHQDVRSAFRETFAAADPSVETDSLLHRRWSRLIPTEESGAISFKVQLTLNASTEHLLGATAEDLLANLGVNRSYLASAIEYMLPCGKYAIEQCDPESGLTEVQDDDITLSNGTLILNMTKKELQFSTLLKKVGYDLKKSEGGNVVSETIQLFICNIKGHTKSGQAQQLLYLIGTVVSLVGLLLTFITYAILPGLRTVPGLGTMNLIAATFMAQLGLLVAGQAASIVHPVLCTALAAFLHYVWLASFSWTSCLALGLSQAFGSPIGMKRQQRSRVSTAKLNALYGWGTPGLIVAACLAVHFAGHQSGALLVYGGDITCWIHPKKANLVVFGVPVMLSLMANIGMFARAVRGVRASKATTKCLKADVSFAQRARQEMVIYVKVSLLMGFSWLWALLGSFTNIDAFWFVFIIFNSFQGAYIFVAFVCNSRVLRILRARLRGSRLDQPRAVRQTTRRERNGRRMPSSSNKTRSSNGS
ncbi:adhesion G-protein coupled receptor D1-like [Acanthaster planci]|uniref:Adhesion G-protein coupled receptor D1-like n=1 Tax=Acanthaster planci TaxID=133434 RepID=A0A8B7Y7J0_ACAPL|nr:adhesion G-protein coupled receptor D1-like [Acanthaster planci]